MKKTDQITENKIQEQALQISEHASEVSDEDIEHIDSDPHLLEACRDLFSVKKVMAEIGISIDVQSRYDAFMRKHRSRAKTVIQWFAAAVVAAVIGIALTLHFHHSPSPTALHRSQMIYIADNKPHPITISGKRIRTVSIGKETSDRTLAVASLAPNVADVFTVTVPKGDVYTLVLTDGTKVYLHPDSRLRFPTNFARSERCVELNGEAYFEVPHDANRPFKVKAHGITTTVLGTEFNVSAYQGQSPHVTLISGSVQVRSGRHSVIIKPGEQSILTDQGQLEIAKVDTDVYTYWRDGYFYYDNVSLEEIMTHLGRTYNMSVEFLSPRMKDYKIHFVAKRSAKIDDVVRTLNKINRIHIIRKGNLLSVE